MKRVARDIHGDSLQDREKFEFRLSVNRMANRRLPDGDTEDPTHSSHAHRYRHFPEANSLFRLDYAKALFYPCGKLATDWLRCPNSRKTLGEISRRFVEECTTGDIPGKHEAMPAPDDEYGHFRNE
jgi:hypothetical protein